MKTWRNGDTVIQASSNEPGITNLRDIKNNSFKPRKQVISDQLPNNAAANGQSLPGLLVFKDMTSSMTMDDDGE
jgi:hypothetical protein